MPPTAASTLPNSDPDLPMLRRFAAGDRDALGELASRHETTLLRLARGLLGGSAPLAEEAVQDAWVRVIAAAASFQARAAVRTWLFRIVINRCRDIARREHLHHLPSGTGVPPVTLPTPGVTGVPPVHENGELAALARTALLALPAEQRETVILCVALGLSHADAAQVLDTPLGTIKSRVRLALARLREQLGDAP